MSTSSAMAKKSTRGEAPKLPRLRTNLPKQARSRLTVHRLLSAAEALLREGGLDAATVPAIASAAGVSVGVVYRRFPDKDNLLRAVYERFFQKVADENTVRLQRFALAEMSLEIRARAIIRGMVEGYRTNKAILRALNRYARTHPDPAFRRMARKTNRATLNHLGAILLIHRDRIHHPNPDAAVEFALLAVASLLHSIILEDEALHDFRTPERLDEELTRMFLGYLGVETI
jgi:AcrR family transcriptional regulator